MHGTSPVGGLADSRKHVGTLLMCFSVTKIHRRHPPPARSAITGRSCSQRPTATSSRRSRRCRRRRVERVWCCCRTSGGCARSTPTWRCAVLRAGSTPLPWTLTDAAPGSARAMTISSTSRHGRRAPGRAGRRLCCRSAPAVAQRRPSVHPGLLHVQWPVLAPGYHRSASRRPDRLLRSPVHRPGRCGRPLVAAADLGSRR